MILLRRAVFCCLYVYDLPCPPQCPLERLLADPHCLAPPKLGVGEFHADTDEASVEEAFHKYAGAGSKVWYVVCLPLFVVGVPVSRDWADKMRSLKIGKKKCVYNTI